MGNIIQLPVEYIEQEINLFRICSDYLKNEVLRSINADKTMYPVRSLNDKLYLSVLNNLNKSIMND